jgi:RNA polymerase sigma factor for flagellar operon FliA
MCIPSPSEDERELWMRFVASRDASLRLALLDVHFPFARMMAARLFARRGGLRAEFSDYLQSAVLGLIEAVDRYDPGRGVPFRQYAVRRIRGSVLDALASMSELHAQYGVPGAVRERIASIDGFSQSVDGKDTALLSLEQMADFTIELGIGFMLERRSDDYAREQDIDIGAYERVERRELEEVFAALVPRLPPEFARVLRYHYFCGIGFHEIALMFGVSRARISQLHREALKRLRKLYEDGGFNISA